MAPEEEQMELTEQLISEFEQQLRLDQEAGAEKVVVSIDMLLALIARAKGT
jgi:hypothetical protein